MITLNGKYYSGEAALVYDDNDKTATIAYKGKALVPVGYRYNIEGQTWEVTSCSRSNYNPAVLNIRIQKNA